MVVFSFCPFFSAKRELMQLIWVYSESALKTEQIKMKKKGAKVLRFAHLNNNNNNNNINNKGPISSFRKLGTKY